MFDDLSGGGYPGVAHNFARCSSKVHAERCLIADRAFAMFAKNVVERFGHQCLKAPSLATCQRMHRERHFGREEPGNLLAALPAGGAGRRPLPCCPRPCRPLPRWYRCRRNRFGYGTITQIGERRFATHAAVFLLRADFAGGVDTPVCRHVHW